MGKSARPNPLPGQMSLFERAEKLPATQVEIAQRTMRSARIPMARQLEQLGWKARSPRTGNPEHFQLRHALQPETYLELGDSYAVLGILATAEVSGVAGCLALRVMGLYPLDALVVNSAGLWLNPLARARTPDGLLGWLPAGGGVTLAVSNPQSGKSAKFGEYYGTRKESDGTSLLLHCEQSDSSIKKFKIKLVAGTKIRVCLVSSSGQILVPERLN